MTTKPSLFWVDPDSFSDLIRRTQRAGDTVVREANERVARNKAVRDEAVRDEATRAPAGSEPILVESSDSSRMESGSQGALAPSAPAVSTSEPAQVLSPPPPDLATGSLEQRLKVFLSWLHPQLGLAHSFVVGDDGLALVQNAEPSPELIAAAAELAHSWDQLYDRFDLSPRNFLSADLAAQSRLHLLSLRTSWGLMSLGLVTQHSNPVPQAGLIAEGFRLALIEKEPHIS